jgi:anti-sigma B factor antagonist
LRQAGPGESRSACRRRHQDAGQRQRGARDDPSRRPQRALSGKRAREQPARHLGAVKVHVDSAESDRVRERRFDKSSPLSARLQVRAGVATLAFTGDLDLATLAIARRSLADAEAKGAHSVEIDVSGVEFFDLSGLRLFFDAHDRWGANLRLIGTSPPIDELLDFSGLSTALAEGRDERPGSPSHGSRFRRGHGPGARSDPA